MVRVDEIKKSMTDLGISQGYNRMLFERAVYALDIDARLVQQYEWHNTVRGDAGHFIHALDRQLKLDAEEAKKLIWC